MFAIGTVVFALVGFSYVTWQLDKTHAEFCHKCATCPSFLLFQSEPRLWAAYRVHWHSYEAGSP